MLNKKEKLWYLGLFAAVFALSFAVMRNIPLFGDDYYYKTFWGENFWDKHIEHYMLANGRAIVHFLATVFISINPIFWQIVNSAFLALIATLAAKHFTVKTAAVVTALAMIPALMVDMTRESVYWLTGSFNYVYPFALLMLFWYLLYSKRGRFLPLLYVLGFFSAATTEQNGMMTVGVTVLYILDAVLIRKEKLSAKIWCLLIPTVIGFCSVYLAPATFVRYGIETEKGMLEVMAEQLPLLYYNFISKKYMLPFIILNFAAMGLWLIKNADNPWQKIIAEANAVSILLAVYISRTPYIYATSRTAVALAVLTVLFAANLILIFTKLLKSKPSGYLTACVAIVLAIGSQLMMSASPVSGSRTMLCGVFNLVIFDIGLLSMMSDKKQYNVIAILIALLFLGFGINTYVDTYTGYKANYPVTAANEEIIEEYLENPTGELEQYTLPYPDHCWSMPYQSSYHLYYYKMYYGLKEDTVINWVNY
ncbi:MAG: hypothetical protein IJ423_00845 [Clostridia bacterium]|nr:hypothetical protein [Clostridia bacterium]